MRTIQDRRANRVTIGLVPEIYDKVSVLNPDSVTEVYVYELMDEAGAYSIVGYVEVVYTSADHEAIVSVTRLAQ
jgi:hypothetical protein